MKELVSGSVFREPSMDVGGWLAAVTWLSVFSYLVDGLRWLMGWRHRFRVYEEDGKSFFEERISLLGLVIKERKGEVDGAPSVHEWWWTDPRLPVMGASFLAVSWALSAHLVVLAIKGADPSFLAGAAAWFVAGMVVEGLALVLWRMTRKRVVAVTELGVVLVPDHDREK